MQHFQLGCLMLAVLLLLAGCTTTTTLTYDVNHYQDGKTLGKDKMEVQFAIASGRSFESRVDMSYSLDGSRITTNYEIETNHLPLVVANMFARYGLSKNLDLGVDGFLSPGGFGFRTLFKVELTDPLSKLGISLMPVFGYASGSEDKTENVILLEGQSKVKKKVSSSGFVFELAVPMSYHLSREVDVFFGPKFYYYANTVSTDYSKSGSFNESGNFSDSFFSPGISFGFRLDAFCPEITLVLVEDTIIPFFGIAFKPDFYY